MTFQESKDMVTSWCQSSNLKLVRSVENERKLFFTLTNTTEESVNFWIIIPQPETNEWVIWSDSDSVIARLADVLDYISSAKSLQIIDILEKVKKSLLLDKTAEDGSASSDNDDYEDVYEDGYYEQDDDDIDTLETETKASSDVEESTADKFFTGNGSQTAVHRLISDLKAVKKSEGKFGVTGEPRGDNLFIWDVHLKDFPKDSILGKDLIEYAKKYNKEPVVYMEMKFPKEYPMTPPFVRVLRPRFKFLTGHVTVGGSVCMEMLTRSGWRPTNDIESILVQIRAEIMSDKNTQLDKHNTDSAYSETEARQSFERMVARYGWNK